MVRAFALIATWLAAALPAAAATYHVFGTKGDDAADGSEARPWLSIDKATRTCLPGDTVVIHEGIYRADRFHLGPAGKDAANRTVFRTAPGERVLLTRSDGTPPGFAMADFMRVEGLWLGGKWTKDEKQPICAVGGSPIGRGRQLVNCTIFGYTAGILVGSSEDLLIQGCRIVHCGNGRFSHGCYLSGGYTKGAMTQHVILDDNAFVAGEGYAIHGWHNPHSCIITRNFVSGYFWDMVMSGSDHLVAHNTLWRNTGQKGREPGWNAWLPAERVVFVNNILHSGTPIFGDLGKNSTCSHNAYLTAAPHKSDAKPLDLRNHRKEMADWIEGIDGAVTRIDAAFNDDVDKIHANRALDKAFAVLRSPPPQGSGLRGAATDIGLLPKDSLDIGRAAGEPKAFWDAFRRLKLEDYNRQGEH